MKDAKSYSLEPSGFAGMDIEGCWDLVATCPECNTGNRTIMSRIFDKPGLKVIRCVKCATSYQAPFEITEEMK